MSLPPLDLTVEITAPDGNQRRWASHLPAQDRPSGIVFTTARFDGFKTAGCRLPRRIDQDFPDLNLFDDLALIGADGTIAFEGRVAALPRTMDSGHSVNVQAVGHMAHAKDRRLQEIIVDRDLSRWGPQSVADTLANYGAYKIVSPEVRPDSAQSSLVTATTGAWTATSKGKAVAVYDAQGVPIGSLYYAWNKSNTVSSTDTDWHWDAVLAVDDIYTSMDSSGELRAAGPGTGTLTATTADRTYATVEMRYGIAGGVAGEEYAIYWTCLAVYGNHGLTKRGTADATTAQGFYASDVISYLAGKYCPRLNTSGVQATSYPIGQLAFLDPVTPYDAFLVCNAPHLWGLEVWENRTLHYAPVDLTKADWQVRLTDPGVSVDLQGDSVDDLANGICVTFQDVRKGRQRRLTPDGYPNELKDTAVANPVNRAGLQVWKEIVLSVPTTQDDALQFGLVALAENNAPQAPGSITFRGHIRDGAGHRRQGWLPRAGQTIQITDHPNDRPRLISETSWDHDSKTARVAVEGMPKRLDAVLDRIGTALTTAGIT